MTNGHKEPRYCERKGCEPAKVAQWIPGLQLGFGPDHPKKGGVAYIDVAVCDYHKRSTVLSHVMDDDSWEWVVQMMAAAPGVPEPVRDLTTLVWQPIQRVGANPGS